MLETKKLSSLLVLLLFTFAVPVAAVEPLAVMPSQKHLNGELINHNGTIYLVEAGKRRGFPSVEELYSHGYNFSMVLPASSEDLSLPQGENMKIRSNSLVLDTSDGRTMYLIYDDGAHPFATLDDFYFVGADEWYYFLADLRGYPKAKAIDTAFIYDPRPSGALIDKIGAFFLVEKDGLAGIPSEAVLYSHGFTYDDAFEANSLEMNAPVKRVLGYREGSLINDAGTVYLISEGKKYGFRTWNGFLARGHHPSRILAGDTSAIELAGVFE